MCCSRVGSSKKRFFLFPLVLLLRVSSFKEREKESEFSKQFAKHGCSQAYLIMSVDGWLQFPLTLNKNKPYYDYVCMHALGLLSPLPSAPEASSPIGRVRACVQARSRAFTYLLSTSLFTFSNCATATTAAAATSNDFDDKQPSDGGGPIPIV
jgi:hypothetical protein